MKSVYHFRGGLQWGGRAFLAGRGPARQHYRAGQSGAEPHLDRVVPQPRVQLQHHGSPGYDQAYVNGRTVFAVMERLTAELFNTFVQRSGDVEPYFTEYCDGKTVTCPGMKQWGTVDARGRA